MNESSVRAGLFSIEHASKNGGSTEPLSQALLAAVRSVRVVRQINVPAMFSITLSMYCLQDRASTQNLDAFALADQISIKMGVDRLTPLIVGKVMEMKASFGADSTVSIQGFDSMHELRFGRTYRVFNRKSVEQIINYIAGKLDLMTVMEEPPPASDDLNAFIVQNGETNYEFLLRLCGQINYEMTVDPQSGQLTFRPSLEDSTSGIPLEFPRDIETMEATQTAETEGGTATVRSYDAETNAIIEEIASYSDERDPMGQTSGYLPESEDVPSTSLVAVRPDLRGREEMLLVAKAQTQIGTSGFVHATAALIGDPIGEPEHPQHVMAGEHVDIAGLGPQFDGLYYVVKSTHTFDVEEGYRCEVELERSSI